MHPVVALVTAGVEMDVLGLTYAEYSDAEREAVVHAHPRTEQFKEDIIQAFYDGIKHKPDTTFDGRSTRPGAAAGHLADREDGAFRPGSDPGAAHARQGLGYLHGDARHHPLHQGQDLLGDGMLDLMPAPGLIYHEWDQHGTCSGLPPGDSGRRRVDIIVAVGPPTVLSAKAATSTIPIVFMYGGDPIKAGLVNSLNRPGGNVTGVTLFTSVLVAKRLELLGELVPAATTIAVLANPNNSDSQSDINDVQKAADQRQQRVNFLQARTEDDIDAAFATLAQQRVAALLVITDPFFLARWRDQFLKLAARYMVPTTYPQRELMRRGRNSQR
jgi:hypothetical protein